MWEAGEIEPLGLDQNIEKTENEPDYMYRWLIIGRVLQNIRNNPSRGISAKFGQEIADALDKRKPYAKVFIDTVRGVQEPREFVRN